MEKHYINKCYNGHLFYREVPTYEVQLIQTSGGTIYANPMSGYTQTEVTLSNIPNTDYIFQSYEVSGSTLYDTNKFKFVDSDVSAIGKFKYYPNEIPLNDQLWTRPLFYNDGGSGITVKEVYGKNVGYYTWDAAKRIETIYSASGWRIPTTQDFEKLYRNVGATYVATAGGFRPAGTYLKSETDWGAGSGIDKFGFDIKPLGYNASPNSTFITNLGADFKCWGSTVTYDDRTTTERVDAMMLIRDDYSHPYHPLYQKDGYFTDVLISRNGVPTNNTLNLMLVKDI